VTLRREPFSWDGGEEQPVPLDEWDFDPSSTGSTPIVGEADIDVRAAQEAIGLGDTEPAISLPIEAHDPTSDVALGGQVTPVGRVLPRKALAISLIAGCLLAFVHGWTTGASVPGGLRCDAAHCRPDPGSNEWKEEQRP
jgi:hypothetical protein